MLAINSIKTFGYLHNVQNKKNLNFNSVQNDVFSPSFKASEAEDDYDFDSPLSDFIIRLKVLRDTPKIIKNSEDIKQQAKLSYNSAKSIFNVRLRKIEHAISCSPELCSDERKEKKYTEYDEGRVKSITTYTVDDSGVSIKQIDIINRNSTKDVILVGQNNQITGLRLGIRQIAPNSYLQKSEITYKDGMLSSYCDAISCVNDGIAKSKIKTKENFYKFKNGLLEMYLPHMEYVGKDKYFKHIYCFLNGKIKKYIEGYADENGLKSHKRELLF